MNKNKNGFTIIEVTIAGMLMVVIGVALVALQGLLKDTQILGFVNYANVDQTNYSVAQMAREIRTMRPGQNGAYPLISGGDNELRFYSDIDFDGVSEEVRYRLNNGILTKTVIEPTGFPAQYIESNAVTRVLSENVQAASEPLFLYFNDGWPEDTVFNPLPTPVSIASVSTIRITLYINVNPANASRSVYSLSTNVNIRMLKNNL